MGDLLNAGQRPLVIGGCCTLLVGVMAALRTHYGDVGLAFVDGHLDYYDGHSSPTGEAADMDLALITGLGPEPLINLNGSAPLIEPANVVLLGYRDEAAARADGARDPHPAIRRQQRRSGA